MVALGDIARKFFSKAFTPTGESVLGIDIGSSAIKIVQARRERGSAVLETYGELALGPYAGVEIGRATSLETEKLAAALADVMKESNVTTRDCGVSIPFSSSLITLIDLPNLPPTQIEKMIPIEARKYIPVPISEVQLDWFVIPEEEAKYFISQDREKTPEGQETVHVLLVAIHNDVLQRYTDMLKKAGLTPSFYEIEIFSTIRSVIERSAVPVAILDIGAASSKLYVVEYGVVQASHLINRGSQDMTLSLASATSTSVSKAEEMKRQYGLVDTNSEEGKHVLASVQIVTNHIFAEAHRALLSYEKRYAKNVSRIVLTGGGSVLKGILVPAQKNFSIGVELGDPFSKMQTPAFLEDVLQQAGPDFAVAVGVALRKLQEH